MFEASSGQTQSEKQSKKNFFVFLKIGSNGLSSTALALQV
jgi:hypothetical protein